MAPSEHRFGEGFRGWWRVSWDGVVQASYGAAIGLAAWSALAGIAKLKHPALPLRLFGSDAPAWVLGLWLSLAALVLPILLRKASSSTRRWLQRSGLTRGDVIWATLLTLSGLGVFAQGQGLASWRQVVLSASGSLLLGRLLAGLWRSRSRHRRQEGSCEESLFEQLVQASSLEPLKDLAAEDRLERGWLVDEVEGVVCQARSVSVTFGLEGGWGSGKTSILRAVEGRLKTRGLSTVWLSAWSYREPERMLMAYLEAIESKLGELRDTFRLPGVLRRIAAGLVGAAPSWARGFLDAALGEADSEGAEAMVERLRAVLSKLDQPLVVFVDDLDRIDRDELQAILRAIRLLSGLPNLTHVLAYDREQLARTLFPEDPGGTRARDFLAKVVNFELPMGKEPLPMLEEMLRSELEKLQVRLEDAERFQAGLESDPRLFRVLAEALATPREVRRVVLHAGWVWQRMARHLHSGDLLIVKTLQLRVPQVYSQMKAHRERFSCQEWKEGKWRTFPGPYTQVLSETKASESESIWNELEAVPLLAVLLCRAKPDDEVQIRWVEARRERRLIYPSCYDRYFELRFPEGAVSEVEFEDFLGSIGEHVDLEARITVVFERIQRECRRSTLESFSRIWDAYVPVSSWSMMPGRSGAWGLDEALAVGVARAALDLERYRDAAPQPGPGVGWDWKIMWLIDSAPGVGEAQALLDRVARSTESFGLLAALRAYAARHAPASAPELTTDSLDRARELLLAGKLSDPTWRILELPRFSRRAVLRHSPDSAMAVERVLAELEESPDRLPRLLEVFAKYVHKGSPPEAIEFDRAALDRSIPRELQTSPAWKQVPSDFHDPINNELVLQYYISSAAAVISDEAG